MHQTFYLFGYFLVYIRVDSNSYFELFIQVKSNANRKSKIGLGAVRSELVESIGWGGVVTYF